MKKVIVIALSILVFGIYLTSCDQSISPDQTELTQGEDLGKKAMLESIALFVDVRTEMTNILGERDFDADMFRNAYLEKNEKGLLEAMKITEKEWEGFNDRLSEARSILFEANPTLESEFDALVLSGGAVCDIEPFLENWKEYVEFNKKLPWNNTGTISLGKIASCETGFDCDWAVYAVVLGMCTIYPPAYVVCAWVAFCSYCWGPEADIICLR